MSNSFKKAVFAEAAAKIAAATAGRIAEAEPSPAVGKTGGKPTSDNDANKMRGIQAVARAAKQGHVHNGCECIQAANQLAVDKHLERLAGAQGVQTHTGGT